MTQKPAGLAHVKGGALCGCPRGGDCRPLLVSGTGPGIGATGALAPPDPAPGTQSRPGVWGCTQKVLCLHSRAPSI